jgi:cytochrome c peroxidase
VGPWTYTPTRFSNQYFILLLKQEWKPVTKYEGGPLQYENEDQLMMLPTDMALLSDSSFKYLSIRINFLNLLSRISSNSVHL